MCSYSVFYTSFSLINVRGITIFTLLHYYVVLCFLLKKNFVDEIVLVAIFMLNFSIFL